MRNASISPWMRVGLTVLLVVACAGLAGLGVWQLHRAAEKQTRYRAYTENQAAAPLDFARRAPQAAAYDQRWRRVNIRGRYLDWHVVLDNRVNQGHPGYEILTPFVADNDTTLLVDRGWVALPDARTTLPEVLAPAEPLTISGYIGPEPTVGIALGSSAAEAEIMRPNIFRVQSVKLPGLATLLQRPLWPAIIYLDAAAPGALTVAWQAPGDGSTRNRSYAVQWFAMAAVLAGIGVWNLYGKRWQRG